MLAKHIMRSWLYCLQKGCKVYNFDGVLYNVTTNLSPLNLSVVVVKIVAPARLKLFMLYSGCYLVSSNEIVLVSELLDMIHMICWVDLER